MVNGMEVHNRCSPYDGAEVDEENFFTCADSVPLPVSPDEMYTFVTTASAQVNEQTTVAEVSEGDLVYVEYKVNCQSEQCAPSPPPPRSEAQS